MQIIHRISFNGDTDSPFFETINALGIKHKVSPLPGRPLGLVTFEIEEADGRWNEILEFVQLYNALDLVRTKFSKEEINNAEYSRLIPIYEQGYPQPEGNMKWKQITYEGECPECGAGYKQISPFNLQSEPSFRSYDFFCLFWTYTIFCKKEIVEVLYDNGIEGYELCTPLIYSSKQLSANVVQLLLQQQTKPGLADIDKVQPENCSRCGITKYQHHRRGLMKYRKASLADIDFQVTYEWFGSGSASGFREIIVSNNLARLIISKGWRGLALKPIELY